MRELSKLNRFLWNYRGRLALGLLFIILTNAVRVVQPMYFGAAIDEIKSFMTITDIAHSKNEFTNNLLFFAFIYAGSTVLSGLFQFVMRLLIIVTSRKIEFDLKNELYSHYQILDQTFFKKNRIGDLMSRMTEDTSQVRMYLGPALMYTINLIILISILLVLMMRIDKSLTILVVILLSILPVSIFQISKKINKKSKIVQKHLSKLTSFVQERMSGIRMIKAFALEKHSTNEFYDLSSENFDKNMDLVRTEALFTPVMVLVIGIGNILIIYYGGLKVIANQISIGEVSEFILYLNMLTWPVISIGWISSLVQRASAAMSRINEFMDQQPVVKNDKTNPLESIETIQFNNVSYQFDDAKSEVLKNLTFSIPKNKIVVVMGDTGSGKSTLIDLLLRKIDPSSGEICINDSNLTNYDLTQYRSQIGFVPQEAFLFSDTISNNIAFGKSEATKEEIQKAAKSAQIHDNILDLQSGYETVIGERGITLSGGQKQRLSIARCIITDPKLYVFDDCLSAVDTETEDKIIEELFELIQNKTAFIVSNRVSSAKKADIVMVLEDGQITEIGSPEDLLNKQGYFYNIYNTQLESFK